MTEEELRKTLIATLQRVREGLLMAADGINQLIQLHEELHRGVTEPHITEQEVSALPWIPHKNGDAEWAFVEPREDDPEEVRALRTRLANYLNAKGKGPRKAVFIGKYRISFSGNQNQFFRRSPAKR